ncbi:MULTISPECIES: fosfomycin resistance glutathione transferase [Pseudoalteromonas]|uniref:VOC domain-containing protein n=1 Tax=Pseudoalteromonas amylolytica TaxID=1859457 RepID=A0A1S1MPM9_9GAMM|nr:MULTISPECIES: fosfomycin resistance glutathione transferase [Pseudoalteromonas]OHU84948.1 hypothetical protein BFC16_19860 [Pseudoalteromonas sp. JW3]OHU90101.1 hypothetical protein BET10_15115 [Pseudoalteromonas amylolytica]
MIQGLNHITLAVSCLTRSLAFYKDVLGFKAHVKWHGGAYLSIGELWLCLSCGKPCARNDYTHIAFAVSPSDFERFSRRVLSAGVSQWKKNQSEGLSLYILDPDGHKLELHVGNLESRLNTLKQKPYDGLTWL